MIIIYDMLYGDGVNGFLKHSIMRLTLREWVVLNFDSHKDVFGSSARRIILCWKSLLLFSYKDPKANIESLRILVLSKKDEISQ